MNLTNKLLLLVICVISLTLVGTYYFQSHQIRGYLEKSQLEWVDTLASGVSEGIAIDTIDGNKIPVSELLRRITKDEAIEFAYVTDMNGDLLAHSFEGGFPRFLAEGLSHHSETIKDSHFDRKYKTKQGDIIEIDAPLIKGLTARIHLGVNQTEVNNLVSKLNQDLFWFISFLAILAFIIVIIIARRISQPLSLFTQQLLKYSNSINKKFPKINTSDPEINNLVKVFENVITQKEKAEKEVLKSQQRLFLHRQLSPIGIIEWTTDFKFADWNKAAKDIFGFTKEEVLGHHITEHILPESAREHVDRVWRELVTNTGGKHSINENITKDGKIITCEWNNTALVNDDGKVVAVASFVEDITQHKNQEELIRRTQKMDALGKLTGGIAHDYNNMLGVILGYTELLQMDLHEQPKLLEYINEIQHASERGAKLTQRLLGFSRQKASEEAEVDLNHLLKDNQDMLEKTLTVRIKLTFDLNDNLWPISVDRGDLEDMLLNMSINAMHSIKESGQITFITRNEHLSLFDAQQLDLDEGDYVNLIINDTGSGMDVDTVNHIFEPFFSTKGNLGTGLGLSQVYGFITRSRGAVKVYSELGHGTRFAIYFPRYIDNQVGTNNSVTNYDSSTPQGTETLLVVDDEASLANLIKNILEMKGYSILVANSGEEALKILSSEKVDAVIADIIMPGMDGYQLTKEILHRYPKIKIQLVSGFTDDRHEDNVPDELNQKLLYKPINSAVLIKRMRELLDN